MYEHVWVLSCSASDLCERRYEHNFMLECVHICLYIHNMVMHIHVGVPLYICTLCTNP